MNILQRQLTMLLEIGSHRTVGSICKIFIKAGVQREIIRTSQRIISFNLPTNPFCSYLVQIQYEPIITDTYNCRSWWLMKIIEVVVRGDNKNKMRYWMSFRKVSKFRKKSLVSRFNCVLLPVQFCFSVNCIRWKSPVNRHGDSVSL